jgi:hypothetical protein
MEQLVTQTEQEISSLNIKDWAILTRQRHKKVFPVVIEPELKQTSSLIGLFFYALRVPALKISNKKQTLTLNII